MDILPHIFRACKVCGVWYEDSSKLLPKLVYSGLVTFVMIHFLLSELIELMRNHHSLKETSEILFGTFNFISCCLKVLNFLSRQNALKNLLKHFRRPVCKSRSPEEEAIIAGNYDFLSKLFLRYLGLCLSTGLVTSVVPLMSYEPKMPYTAYHMWNISEPTGFYVACALQLVAVFYVILISVTLDTLAFGFMILATGQIELNCHRIVNSTTPLKRCVEHQILIHNVVHEIENIFIPVVGPQFFFSLITLCSSTCIMSQMRATDPEFVSFTMCYASMLTQVFVYCWFGNELKLKNQQLGHAAYSANWIDCRKEERNNLWFIMLYAKRATTISYHGQCGLHLDTAIWIVKTSYAAFNLLRKATK